MKDKGFLDSLLEGVAGALVGYALGELANERYRESTPEERELWRRNRIMHHGKLGSLILIDSVGRKRPFYAGTGIGLMLSDLQDIDEW